MIILLRFIDARTNKEIFCTETTDDGLWLDNPDVEEAARVRIIEEMHEGMVVIIAEGSQCKVTGEKA